MFGAIPAHGKERRDGKNILELRRTGSRSRGPGEWAGPRAPHANAPSTALDQ